MTFKVGDKVSNRLNGGYEGVVAAVVADRIVVTRQTGYYSLHTLAGTFLGHWWPDNHSTSTKPWYDASTQTNLDYYHVDLFAKPRFKVVYDDGVVDEDFQESNFIYRDDVNQAVGVFIKNNDKVKYLTINEFKSTFYYLDAKVA